MYKRNSRDCGCEKDKDTVDKDQNIDEEWLQNEGAVGQWDGRESPHGQLNQPFFMLYYSFLFQDAKVDSFMQSKLDITLKELIEERDEALMVCEE